MTLANNLVLVQTYITSTLQNNKLSLVSHYKEYVCIYPFPVLLAVSSSGYEQQNTCFCVGQSTLNNKILVSLLFKAQFDPCYKVTERESNWWLVSYSIWKHLPTRCMLLRSAWTSPLLQAAIQLCRESTPLYRAWQKLLFHVIINCWSLAYIAWNI